MKKTMKKEQKLTKKSRNIYVPGLNSNALLGSQKTEVQTSQCHIFRPHQINKIYFYKY